MVGNRRLQHRKDRQQRCPEHSWFSYWKIHTYIPTKKKKRKRTFFLRTRKTKIKTIPLRKKGRIYCTLSPNKDDVILSSVNEKSLTQLPNYIITIVPSRRRLDASCSISKTVHQFHSAQQLLSSFNWRTRCHCDTFTLTFPISSLILSFEQPTVDCCAMGWCLRNTVGNPAVFCLFAALYLGNRRKKS